MSLPEPPRNREDIYDIADIKRRLEPVFQGRGCYYMRMENFCCAGYTHYKSYCF